MIKNKHSYSERQRLTKIIKDQQRRQRPTKFIHVYTNEDQHINDQHEREEQHQKSTRTRENNGRKTQDLNRRTHHYNKHSKMSPVSNFAKEAFSISIEKTSDGDAIVRRPRDDIIL